jgi:crossover junction endodeoxyribonuclease RuvC
MTNRIKIAIDPGASGAMAIRYPDGAVVVHDFKQLGEAGIRDELETALQYDDTTVIEAVMERVHSFPGQGVASTFKFGANYGFWRGLLQGLRVPFREITPQQWQKPLGIGKKEKADRKRALKQLAAERYPQIRVNLNNADALLLLEA